MWGLRLVHFVVLLGCSWQGGWALPRDKLFPFGTEQGDKRLEQADDVSSTEIPLNIPVAFYDQIYYSIFVSIPVSLEHA